MKDHARLAIVSPAVVLAFAAFALAPALAPLAARAHHVGTYTPRDNDVSANFKQVKFSMQAGKFDVARRLFDGGALRKAMRARTARLPAGLEDAVRAGLSAGDTRRAEAGLAAFLAALARELAVEADEKIADTSLPVQARAAATSKFLEAIWRYWNLIDFVVSERDPKSSVAIRLAFDDAEGALKPTAVARGPGAVPSAPSPAAAPPSGRKVAADTRLTAADLEGARASLTRIADVLSSVVQALSTQTRRTP